MNWNKTYVGSVINQTCPKCREGKLFSTHPYDLKRFMQMPTNCDKCGQKYELHTSFFYGAMYISYALQVAWFTFIWLLFSLILPKASYTTMAVTIIVTAILLLPLVLRWSRSIWIHLFVKYRGKTN